MRSGQLKDSSGDAVRAAADWRQCGFLLRDSYSLAPAKLLLLEGVLPRVAIACRGAERLGSPRRPTGSLRQSGPWPSFGGPLPMATATLT